jgi:hypothetical protein
MTRMICWLIHLWDSDFSTFISFVIFPPIIGAMLAVFLSLWMLIINMLTGGSFSILYLLIFFGTGIGTGLIFGLFVGGITELSKLF